MMRHTAGRLAEILHVTKISLEALLGLIRCKCKRAVFPVHHGAISKCDAHVMARWYLGLWSVA